MQIFIDADVRVASAAQTGEEDHFLCHGGRSIVKKERDRQRGRQRGMPVIDSANLRGTHVFDICVLRGSGAISSVEFHAMA